MKRVAEDEAQSACRFRVGDEFRVGDVVEEGFGFLGLVSCVVNLGGDKPGNVRYLSAGVETLRGERSGD